MTANQSSTTANADSVFNSVPLSTSPSSSGEKSIGEKPTFKRDYLINIEREMQAQWQRERLFEQDAPNSNSDKCDEKFMVTFPYPYMNGRLHLGHCFSLSKAEFAAAYERLQGKRVLFPFAFHCTGMPIVAAAGKLRKEIAEFGSPPRFPEVENDNLVDKAVKQHSKVAAKTGTVKYQWQIMLALGIPEEVIPKFQDPLFWTKYFPSLAEQDLVQMGCGIDWRRSFITTEANPFYNRFIEWQFRKLYRQGRIKFGKRNTIYSPMDMQPCLDHDRASGEGVEPKEFTAIKIQILEPVKIDISLSNEKVFLVAATLRPETMYGQTNCWVGPDVTYGVFQNESSSEYLVCTERAARNMAFQDRFPVFGKYVKVKDVKGSQLIGLEARGPLSLHSHFYVLPMLSVSANIGTGIVTSVPSSSPDDFATLRDLKDKPALRAKFGIQDEWVLPFEVIKVCESPSLTSPTSSCPAEFACQKLGIKSQNDRDLLDQAKEMVYKGEFYGGIMAVGPYLGQPVNVVKPKIQQALIESNDAFMYYEPESKVISRSGDECVVGLCDQWFLNYGEPEWRDLAKKCLSNLEVYMPEVLHQFQQTFDWMQQWACSRSVGLGTKLPWDPTYVIESLSDSTIYMAYYTIAHILHQGSLDGSIIPNKIRPEQMTDEVWEYIFGNDNIPFPSESGLSSDILERMRREFRYFYPMDLRVSGKDLVPNHLTMSIYNHVAIWQDQPDKWPRAFRANGHLLLNSEKMSKSTGNFLTMHEAINGFGADATRIALADAGDSVEDANFVQDTADKSILRLYSSYEQYKEFINSPDEKLRRGELTMIDCVFLSEMATFVTRAHHAYERMEYREALKEALFEFQNGRDFYRDVCVVHGNINIHATVMKTFFEWQCRILAPIAPHFCDHFWRNLLGKSETVLTVGIPDVKSFLASLDISEEEQAKYLAIGQYLRKTAHELRLMMANDKNAKGKTGGSILVARKYPQWQEAAISILRQHFDSERAIFSLEDAQLVQAVKNGFSSSSTALPKKLIPFAMEMKKQMMSDSKNEKIVNRKLAFDEVQVLKEHLTYMQHTLGLDSITVTIIDDDSNGNAQATSTATQHENILPGQPSIRFL